MLPGTEATFETDSFVYSALVSVVHLYSGRIGGFHESTIARDTVKDASRAGKELLPEPSEDASDETRETPLHEHTYTGGDERFKARRENRLRR